MIYIILIESLAVPSYGGSFPNYKIYFARLLIKTRSIFLSFIEYQSQLDTLVFNNIFLYLTGVRYRS